jgi:hypothetical protein
MSNVLLTELAGGGSLPLNPLFAELAQEWSRRNPNARSSDLASLLSVRPQSCSQWKTGTDGRRPTWAALVFLAHSMNKEIVINSEGIYLKRKRRRNDSDARKSG